MSTLKVNQIYEADGSQFRFNTDVVKLQSQTGSDLGGALIFDDLDVVFSFVLGGVSLPSGGVSTLFLFCAFSTTSL